MENQNARAWPMDFPNVTALADYKTFKEHPDYEAAKSGDINAAVRLVHALINKSMDGLFIS